MKNRNKYVDFSDTQTAFASKSDKELRKALWLFKMMHRTWLVDLATVIGGFAVRWHLPFAKVVVKQTVFEQFVGGESLVESQESIEKLWQSRILTVLDYGAEGKSSEGELDAARDQFLKAITFAASSESVPMISIKVSALAKNQLLEAVQTGRALTELESNRFKAVKQRIDQIAHKAHQHGVMIFVDAEESWIQDTIDDIVEELMAIYNRDKVIVYQTFQMYRRDRYEYLTRLFDRAKENGYWLGAKLVRGAYMEKERDRAEDHDYTSPIHATKKEVDLDYDKAIKFCIDHYEDIASCAATHNAESCLYQAELIADRGLPRHHPHLNFCQLYGMSDHITFNLAANGFNVAKYVVYGKVEEVVPYLSRRAEENTAAKGEFGREYRLLQEEYLRRKSQ